MPPRTPMLLVSNVFDRINYYPTAVLTSTSTAAGTDVRYVADYRRERTWWLAATTDTLHSVTSTLGAGETATCDTLWIDRGHNLWGKAVGVQGSDGAGGALVTLLERTVPAQGTVGGDPSLTWCVTEEGSLYTYAAAAYARRSWQIYVRDVWQPRITGVILGARTQLEGYSQRLDEDAGRRTVRQEESLAGYVASDRVYSGRTLELQLQQIGAPQYDATIRSLREVLFARNQPVVIAMNWGTRPERAWLYRLDQTQWSFGASRLMRGGTMTFRELYPAIR